MIKFYFLHVSRIFVVILFFVAVLLAGCYDDGGIQKQLDELGDRLGALEELCQKQNSYIASLKVVIDALQKQDFVTGITPIKEDEKIVGYTIIFSQSGNVNIYNGKEGAAGQNGHTPVIAVRKDVDGNYYWTLDGEWLFCEGQKVTVNGKDGATPKLKIQDGMWHISYDGGLSWAPESLGPAVGADSMFSKIAYDEHFVYLTLADKVTTLTLPRKVDGQGVGPVSVTLGEVTSEMVTFNGHINATLSELYYIQVIIRYGVSEKFSAVDESLPCVVINRSDLKSGNDFVAQIKDLNPGTTYNYCIIVQNRDNKEYGDVLSFQTPEKTVDGVVWTYGLSGMPDPATWKVVETYGSEKYGLQWDASYGWFDCNKLEPNGGGDSKLCWAAAASNMIHWWLKFNETNIAHYGKYKGPSGYVSSTDEGVFKFFKTSFFNNGNPVPYALNWFFTGLNQFSGDFNIPHSGVVAGFFKDVLGENTNIVEYYEYPSAVFFTEKVKDALCHRKCISLVHNYAGIPHAINMWGAKFDAQGNITQIYITDNNDIDLEKNQAPQTPAGLLKRQVKNVNGKMCMENWEGNCTIEIQGITLLSLMSEKWAAYLYLCALS